MCSNTTYAQSASAGCEPATCTSSLSLEITVDILNAEPASERGRHSEKGVTVVTQGNGTRRGSSFLLRPFLICAIGASLGCSVTPPQTINEKYRELIEQRRNAYRLKPGDVIRIESSTQDPALNQRDVHVLPDGNSDLFLLGDYKVGGKTVGQVRTALKRQLADRAESVDVRIQVEPAETELVHTVGQFVRPQLRLEMTVNMTLQEVISSSGGLRVTGDTDWALLRRPFLDPFNPDVYRIDLNDWSEDIYLLPGDQIVVGRNFGGAVVHYLAEFIFGIIPSSAYYFAAL